MVNIVIPVVNFIRLYTYKKKGEFAPNITKASLERLKEKIKTITRKTTPMSLDERMVRLRRLVHGWINYFKLGGIGSRLKQIDNWIRNRLRYCIWSRVLGRRSLNERGRTSFDWVFQRGRLMPGLTLAWVDGLWHVVQFYVQLSQLTD